jgi:hypothetical protein
MTDTALRDELILAFDNMVVTEEDANKYYLEFAYQGLDPLLIYRTLKNRARNKGVSELFKDHMTKLMLWYVMRGSRISGKALLKSKQEARDFLSEMSSIYGITDNVPKTSDDITLARITAVFPHIVAKYIILMNKEPVGWKELGVDSIPRYLAFPGAPSIIPEEEWEGGMRKKFLEWAVKFDAIIKARPEPDKVATYADTVFKSSLFNKDQRKRMLNRVREVVPLRKD